MTAPILREPPTALRSVTSRSGRSAAGGIAALAAVVILAVLASEYKLWLFVINGISDGAIYSLAAIGLVLTYKTSGIFNFAIGAQAALSAYLFYMFRITDGLPWPVAALLALILGGLVASLVLERVASLLSDAPPVMKVVATIGLLVLLQSALTGHFGPATLQFKQFLPTSHVTVAGINIQASQFIVVGVAIAATAGLYVFFKRQRVGIAMQAVVDDPDLLALQATSPVTVRRYAWVIGSCFVSISGMLIAPELGVDVNDMLLLFITSFGAAAVAAFTSIPITFGASIVIGIIMNVMSDRLATQSNQVLSELYTQVPFLVVILALMILPKRKLTERAGRRIRKLSPPHRFDTATVGAASAAGLAVAITVPFVVPHAYLDVYTTGLGFSVILASLGLVLWTSGQISLCQVAFAAIGATTFAHLQHSGVPWLLSVLLAALITLPVGALVAIPSFRLSGIYLAVATFGVGLLFQNLLYTTFLLFGQTDNQTVSRPHILGLHTYTDTGYYLTSLAVAVVCMGVVVLVRRSRLGLMLRALSDSPVALDAHGADSRITRISVFSISAGLAAVGGAIIAGVTLVATGEPTGPFGYFNSLALVAVLAFCWRQPVLSPVIAAFVFEVLKVYSPFSDATVVKYEGVGFGILALVVALGPALRLPSAGRSSAARGERSPVADRLLFGLEG